MIVENLKPDAPLNRARYPKEWFWYDPFFEVLAGIHDAVHNRAATGSRREGIKKREIPKPMVRPWDKKKEEETLVGDVMPIDEMRKALGW